MKFKNLSYHRKTSPQMCNVSESILSGCFRSTYGPYGVHFWTAGQRIDPSTESPFVWRVTSTETYSDTVSVMNYTNWDTGRPNNDGPAITGIEACMHMWSGLSYRWNDICCSFAMCAVCEIDI